MFETVGARVGSALIGDVPNNQNDFYIIRGWYRSIGLYTANSSAGYIYAATKPEGAVYESKQTMIILCMIIVILTIVVPTAARITVRLQGNRTKFGSDDWAIIVAASVAVVYPCLQIATVVNNGAGRHIWENTYVDFNQYTYNLGVAQLIFYVAVGLTKLSIAFFVRRLADKASQAWRIFIDIFMGTLFIYLGFTIFLWAFSCSPRRARWDKLYAGSLEDPAICANSTIQVRVLSIMHLAQGMILLGSPIAILWHVRIELKKKVGLFFIWLVGGMSIVGGLLQQINVTVTNDGFWQYTDILRWTSLDLALGVMVASLPVLDAAIINIFVTVGTKLGASHSHSNAWTQANAKTVIKESKDHPEHVQGIYHNERYDWTGLGIIRTDEVRLSYHSISSFDSQGQHKYPSRVAQLKVLISVREDGEG